MEPKLSILIPSTYDRERMTENLVKSMRQRIFNQGEVEILVEYDNREISVGAKRQKLLEKATGKYVAHVDSDDAVDVDYFPELLKAIDKDCDHIGFRIRCTGTKYKQGIVSSKFTDWKEVNGVYQRSPYHKSCMKREIQLQIGFADMRFGEDYDFAKRLHLSGLIQSEVFINKYLYFYRYQESDFRKKYGFDKD